MTKSVLKLFCGDMEQGEMNTDHPDYLFWDS